MTRKSNEETEYEVGYGKPPKANQFAKGRSGNPKGRKKGKSVGSILHEVLNQRVNITKDGRSRKVRFSEAFINKVIANALNGTTRDHVLLLNLILQHAPEALRGAAVPHTIEVEFV